jgi:hypothetical protein
MDDGFNTPGPATRRFGELRVRGAALTTAAGLLTGGLLGGYAIAHAATGSSTSTPSPAPASGLPGHGPGGPGGPGGSFDPTQGGHVGANGVVEKLLSGDTAAKVRAAALAAVPGATILRVENDAEGSPYEAHMTKSDGSVVTVTVDSNFKVTSILNGLG